ncbi:ABC transporter substrate-binding protein [Streptomyces tsukubensis]|uniref:Branched-chain amino acid ABC transporter substrate-binding protein n=2 Tax=Streptomyces tsukubensis TaxID=83656 RepID=A0A1V4A7T3_9ACTN|nr:branched-chain amino acid ABC transporter substrate-binding protein [Streptomyces tsukubensis]QFR97605.1 ABC transporter substrate-binding protein [Streptomyces tsukubensis]
MSSQAGIDVQHHIESLVHGFRTREPLMPVLVLHVGARTTDSPGGETTAALDQRVASLVAEVREGQKAHGSRCASPTPATEGPTEAQRAAHLVRGLGDPRRWGGPGRRSGRDGRSAPRYRRYAFPRLRLVRAIHDAVKELDGDTPAPAPTTPDAERAQARALLDQLARQRWRPAGGSRWRPGPILFDTARVLPASVVAGIAAFLAGVDQWVALAVVVGLLVFLAVLNYWPTGRAPIFLWLRRESRWFMTTTFLLPVSGQQPSEVRLLHPVHSWRAIAARADDVAKTLREGGQAQLQLHVLALLEDLRDNHRRWSWDLRGLKRTRPPMLFLPGADVDSGSIALIKAVSDVRSGRSELDPLLIVASVAAADVARLDQRPSGIPLPPAVAPATLRDTIRRAHQEWERNLRVRQAPSRSGAVPWELRLPLPPDTLAQLEEQRRWCVRSQSRPGPVRLVWSLPVLSLAVLLLVASLGYRALQWHDDFCDAGILTVNRDSRLMRGAHGGASTDECVGTATGDVRFADRAAAPPGVPDPGAQYDIPWTLGGMEDRIHRQNQEVTRDHAGDYVTVVYAGPLSSGPQGESSPVKGVAELGGVYLAQAVINKAYDVKLRVLVANGGLDMDHQSAMADTITAYAAHDPTVVGVVGLGRDLESSSRTTRKLRDAGLAVVSGTNSAEYLPRTFPNWFSLAAPDDWQADQLGLVVRQLRTPGTTRRAMVLAQATEDSGDRYTKEQAKYGGRMLRREKFAVLPRRTYALDDGKPEMRGPVQRICGSGSAKVPSVIYFAGRVEDLDPLMKRLSTEPGCRDRQISVLTGDDLSKAVFRRGGDGVADNVTLYHAALADLGAAEARTQFYEDAESFLPGISEPAGAESPFLASGQTALSHDATRALYEAASEGDGPQNRVTTWVNLRSVNMSGMATGTIDFTRAPLYRARRGHGIELVRVRRDGRGGIESTKLCGRTAGNTEPLTVKECSIEK